METILSFLHKPSPTNSHARVQLLEEDNGLIINRYIVTNNRRIVMRGGYRECCECFLRLVKENVNQLNLF